MQTCPHCAEEIENGVTICPYCGDSLRRASNPVTSIQEHPQSANSTMWPFAVRATLGCGFLFVAFMIAVLLWPIHSSIQSSPKKRSRNNLKQIGLGLHNYHDANKVFPPGGVFDEDGHAHHSWQTFLLPFVDQAPIYRQIDFHVPWNDSLNAAYFQNELPVYLNPSLTERQSIEGYALSHYAGNSRLLNENTSTSIREITDSTAYTILAGEVSSGLQPWGFPANYRNPAQGVGGGPGAFGRRNFGAQFLMLDGSVRLIDERTHLKVLEALSTPDGGEAFDD
jgi:hypothetical protein